VTVIPAMKSAIYKLNFAQVASPLKLN